MIGNCKDCKWWRMSPTGWGACRATEKLPGRYIPRLMDGKAFVPRSSAELWTTADFGCVQYHAKEQA
jgi:hypothetical protein